MAERYRGETTKCPRCGVVEKASVIARDGVCPDCKEADPTYLLMVQRGA